MFPLHKCNSRRQTSFISFHMSFAVMPEEFPDTTKQGHSETRTSLVFSAAIAKVTGESPLAILHQLGVRTIVVDIA